MLMVTEVYKREHLHGCNDIHDILSLVINVDSIDDRQYIFLIYLIHMIKQKVWIFSHCIA